MDDSINASWQDNLVSALKNASSHALPDEKYQNLVSRRNQLLYPQYMPWGLMERLEYASIEGVLEPCRVRVHALAEFSCALRLSGFNKAAARETLAHENAHMNLAEHFGAVCKGYILELSKTVIKGREAYFIHPSSDIDIPDEWNREKQDFISRLIVRAPELYGESLSEGDQAELLRLDIS